MAVGIPINGEEFIGYEFHGIKILNVYRTSSGKWGAQVQCSCGRIFKTSLRQARGLCACTHRKKRPKND